LLAGISGGPDSVFLLEQLRLLRRDYGLRLCVAHVNHCLRGKDSDGDEAFVAALAAGYGLPFFRCRVNTAAVAKTQKMSLEDAGRMLRYNFFLNLCNVHGIDKIVLAHTKDDQSETVLMRLLRGTGITGLAGMRPLTVIEGKKVIRPLLVIEKRQITGYLRKRAIASRTDASNLVPEFFRNKIRLELVPLLEKLSPHVKDNLCRIADNAREAEDFLRQTARRDYARLVSKGRDGVARLEREFFSRLMPVRRSGLIRAVMMDLLGSLQGIDSRHVRIADDFICAKNNSGRSIDLPKGVVITQSRGYCVFRLAAAKRGQGRALAAVRLPLARRICVPGLRYSFIAQTVNKITSLKKHSSLIEYFDLDTLSVPLRIRTRKDGDVVRPLGSSGAKKLKKFLIDEKIDNFEKDRIPLVVSGKHIVWVVGVRIADPYKVTAATRRILKISAEKSRG